MGDAPGAPVDGIAAIDVNEILHLPLDARLASVERIWERIAADRGAVSLPEEHRAELARRRDAPASGAGDGVRDGPRRGSRPPARAADRHPGRRSPAAPDLAAALAVHRLLRR